MRELALSCPNCPSPPRYLRFICGHATNNQSHALMLVKGRLSRRPAQPLTALIIVDGVGQKAAERSASSCAAARNLSQLRCRADLLAGGLLGTRRNQWPSAGAQLTYPIWHNASYCASAKLSSTRLGGIGGSLSVTQRSRHGIYEVETPAEEHLCHLPA
ncbi:hypothetical protein BDV96DRAFT_168306 [Lophiotrema nucula]|uniref:Uncharacterized protein n=1 Tax=Lophiotrema nucula TaxID=690887 RepID=A0A6A5YY55_9PLEO|nr:hypothetical protein BDV96DRAFT_168306 [Lophiotrema nucula]